MKPIDFRNETFEQIRERLSEDRRQVHHAWLAHGPGTTRDVAAKAQIDILSFRPRSTELYQLGLLDLIDKDGHQGVYQARTLEQWEAHVATKRVLGESQLSLV
jgi:hypothetical protein